MLMQRRVLLVAVALSASSHAMQAQNALDYPQWRGQRRDGAASGFVAPTTWPAALTRRWTADVGEGYATPILVGETVYVFTRHAGSEGLTALDATTGDTRWRTTYPVVYTPNASITQHGAGPKATPLFHEGKVFTLGITGILSAFDAATGARVWQTASPDEAPFFSAASSPLGVEGLVVAHPGNYGPLTAFDSGTGQIRWSAGGGGFFASPIVATLGGTHQVISATQDSVIGVALDGRVLWSCPWKGGGGSTTPVLNGEMIIVGAPEEGVVGLTPIVRGGVWDCATAWRTADVTVYLSNPVVIADTLFGLSTRQRGQLFALDARTGRVLWLGPPREANNTAIVKSEDLLVLLNDDAELIVAKGSPLGFEPIVRYSVAGSATWAQPTLSGRRIFVKDVTSLTLWTVD